MLDLKERFQALDQVPAPDLRRVIELRAGHLASLPGSLRGDLDETGGRYFRVETTHLLAAAAIVVLALGLAVIVHFARSGLPSRHGPPPTPPPGQVLPYRGIWPQLSIEDARYAQQRADTGDAAYSWQVDSLQDAHVAERFLQERLGWARAVYVGTEYDPPDHRGQDYEARAVYFHYIECGRGTNQLYPQAAAAPASASVGGSLPTNGANCAPTIDQTHYHTVRVRSEQPARHGRTGIWVVTGYEEVKPYVQSAPPSEADVRRLMDAYMMARLAGTGAEKYLGGVSSYTTDHVELYATTGGSPYRRYEITSILGPDWPRGTFRVFVLLTAQDGGRLLESTYVIDAAGVRKATVFASNFTVQTTGFP